MTSDPILRTAGPPAHTHLRGQDGRFVIARRWWRWRRVGRQPAPPETQCSGARYASGMTRHPRDVPRLRRRKGRGADGSTRVERGVREFAAADLPPGEVEVRVGWSSVNYKDGLATRADGKVARISPIIPGIDMAGEVVASGEPAIAVGLVGGGPWIRPGCRPSRRLQRVPARAGRLGRATAPRSDANATRWPSGRPGSRRRCRSWRSRSAASSPATGRCS